MKNQQLKRTTLNGWGKVLTVALLFCSSPVNAQQLTVNSEPIQNPLPCMESSHECINQLTQSAIVNSPELKLLGEKITIVEQQLELLGGNIARLS